MKTRIIVLIPYFGKFPDYFPLWLLSAGYNPQIDFLIFTDIKQEYALPSNVRIEKIKWHNMQKKIKAVLGETVIIHEPYKLCDYRPAYGQIFAQYIQGYDFWGHCDLDMILGDIRKFLPENIFDTYERIFTRGHFCLYRNTIDNNLNYKKTLKMAGINYIDAFHTKYSCHFDEGMAIKEVFSSGKLKTYDMVCFADILYKRFPFKLAQKLIGSTQPQVYYWKDGKVMRCYLNNDQILSDEFMYLHLQKRKMEVCIKNPKEGFLVVPNQFLEFDEITQKLIKQYSQNNHLYDLYYFINRFKSIVKNVRNGALIFRINGKAYK